MKSFKGCFRLDENQFALVWAVPEADPDTRNWAQVVCFGRWTLEKLVQTEKAAQHCIITWVPTPEAKVEDAEPSWIQEKGVMHHISQVMLMGCFKGMFNFQRIPPVLHMGEGGEEPEEMVRWKPTLVNAHSDGKTWGLVGTHL